MIIEFRGRHFLHKRWVYGFLIIDKSGTHFIRTRAEVMYIVDPESVGQYTNLDDKNGKRIYGAVGKLGGDIVKYVDAVGKYWFDADNSAYDDFLTKETPTARKKHICFECKRDILPGEKYERVFGKWDGDVDTFKTCQDCLSARDAFFCSSGYAYGKVWSGLKSILADYEDGDCLSAKMLKCTERARGKISNILEAKRERGK